MSVKSTETGQAQGNHKAGGSTARSGLPGLETVEKKKTFCKTPGVLPGEAFSFLDDIDHSGDSITVAAGSVAEDFPED